MNSKISQNDYQVLLREEKELEENVPIRVSIFQKGSTDRIFQKGTEFCKRDRIFHGPNVRRIFLNFRNFRIFPNFSTEWIFQKGCRDPRSAKSVRILKKGCRDPRTDPLTDSAVRGSLHPLQKFGPIQRSVDPSSSLLNAKNWLYIVKFT